jgi:hypothetical protein
MINQNARIVNTVLLVLVFGAVMALVFASTIKGADSSDGAEDQYEQWTEDQGYSQEAELLALSLSGELRAPQDLYSQIKADLAAVRSQYGTVLPWVQEITHRPAWVSGSLAVGFDDMTAQGVVRGEYEAWDELNREYGVTDISEVTVWGVVTLTFEDSLHPERLAELYVALPGVEYAEPDLYVGDSSNVQATQTDSGLGYLFSRGWGDCAAGCIHSEYWYFIVEDDGATYVGHRADGDPEPDWWLDVWQS